MLLPLAAALLLLAVALEQRAQALLRLALLHLDGGPSLRAARRFRALAFQVAALGVLTLALSWWAP